MPNDAPAPPMLVPPPEAARLLAVSPRTLWSLSAPRGPIPVVKIGARTYYDPADVRQWVERAKVRPAAPAQAG